MPIRVSTTSYFAWHRLVQPYLKSTQVLLYPSKGNAITTSYTYNWYVGAAPGAASAAGRNLSSIALPSQMPMLVDGVGSNFPNDALFFIFPSGGSPTGKVMLGRTAVAGGSAASPVSSGLTSPRHFEGSNLAFADGHVKWYKSVGGVTFSPTVTFMDAAPPQDSMDFNGDGILGNDASNGTAGIWD